jgi:hypothetical protein
MKNPALRKEKRYEPAPVIPLKQDGSLLDWLEENGRIIYREEKVIEKVPLEEEEISDLSELIEDQEDEFEDDVEDDI